MKIYCLYSKGEKEYISKDKFLKLATTQTCIHSLMKMKKTLNSNVYKLSNIIKYFVQILFAN